MKDKVTGKESDYNLKVAIQSLKMIELRARFSDFGMSDRWVPGLIGRTGHEFANRKGIKASTVSILAKSN